MFVIEVRIELTTNILFAKCYYMFKALPLSYSIVVPSGLEPETRRPKRCVIPVGVEPTTYALEVHCSNPLSYGTI